MQKLQNNAYHLLSLGVIPLYRWFDKCSDFSLSKIPVLSQLNTYVELSRGTPLLIQLFLIYLV